MYSLVGGGGVFWAVTPGPKGTKMGVSIQINRTEANLVLIDVKTILPTLLSVDLYPIGIGLRVPSGI